MNMFHSFWTLALFLVFLGIIFWAWSSRRKSAFDDAARLPMDDDKIDPGRENNG